MKIFKSSLKAPLTKVALVEGLGTFIFLLLLTITNKALWDYPDWNFAERLADITLAALCTLGAIHALVSGWLCYTILKNRQQESTSALLKDAVSMFIGAPIIFAMAYSLWRIFFTTAFR